MAVTAATKGLQGRILQHRSGASTTSMVNPAVN